MLFGNHRMCLACCDILKEGAHVGQHMAALWKPVQGCIIYIYTVCAYVQIIFSRSLQSKNHWKGHDHNIHTYFIWSMEFQLATGWHEEISPISRVSGRLSRLAIMIDVKCLDVAPKWEQSELALRSAAIHSTVSSLRSETWNIKWQ